MRIGGEDLQHLCQLSRELMYVSSPDGTLIGANTEIERLLGFAHAEIAGKSVDAFLHREDIEFTKSSLARAAPGEPVHLENRWRTRGGKWRLISWTLVKERAKIYGIGRDITEERVAEQARGDTAAEAALMTDNIPGLLAYIDAEGRYAQVSETYTAWFELPAHRILGRRVEDVLTERIGRDYWEQIRPVLERALAGHPAQVEALGSYPGGRRYVEIHYKPDFDASGRVRGVVTLVLDITERKRSEIDLAFRAALLDNALEPILAWNLGAEIIYWNPTAATLYGYSRDEALGRRSHDLLQTRLPWRVEEFERRLAEQGEWRGELIHTTKDGRRITVESRHRVVRVGGRDVVIESNRDITDRLAAEAELRESEEKYRYTVELSGQIAWTANAAGMIEDFSRLGYELTGLTPAEAAGQGWFRVVHREDRRVTRSRWREAVRTGSAYEVEHRIRVRGGSYRWMRSRSFARRGADGAVIRWYGTTEDIDDRKRSELMLAELNRELENRVSLRTRELAEINRELETFSYSVSHDLRAPLRAIDGFGKILAEDESERLSEAGIRCIQRIRANTQRMGELIDDLLELSRVSRHPLDPGSIDLSSIAESVIEELRRADPARNVDIRIEPGMTARGDARLMRIALENLLGNAWKYTGKTPNARIEFAPVRAGGETAWAVRDNGAGFDPAYVRQLFAPFQRLHREAEFPGSGIGLATVARIIHRHGGRVWAEGEPGKGAAFYFTLAGERAKIAA